MDFSGELAKNLYDFQDGDENTWQRIIEENSQWLYAICLRFVKNPDESEDIVQDTFILAFRSRKQLKDINKLRGWLRKICVRLCLRKSKKVETVSIDDVEAFLPGGNADSPDKIISSKEELEKVLKGLARLSPRQRACITLSVFEELSMDEIAETLEISSGAVKRYIYEARQSLRQIIQ